MAKEYDPKSMDKLVKLVKSNPGESETFYCEKSGIPRSQILRYLVAAEVLADPKLKMPATGPSIKKAREAGVRWPRIAARANISVAQAKALFEEHTGTSAVDSYTGRGRKSFTSTGASSGGKRTVAKTKSAGKRGTSGRRASASSTKSGSKTKTTGRRGTRASATAADPK